MRFIIVALIVLFASTTFNTPSALAGDQRRIRLCNKWSSASVRVDVRVGDEYNCADMTRGDVFDVPENQCVEISTAHGLCYRRAGSGSWNRAPEGSWDLSI